MPIRFFLGLVFGGASVYALTNRKKIAQGLSELAKSEGAKKLKDKVKSASEGVKTTLNRAGDEISEKFKNAKGELEKTANEPKKSANKKSNEKSVEKPAKKPRAKKSTTPKPRAKRADTSTETQI
ncbi:MULTISPECIES: hypothetical protein [unclassified Campylobacter]|uniref:hypothetical protein n=1 Tax=unclassified Campylobacter TaxID=2593542 RepID=UPI0022EA0C18|nr:MULTISPECIES: hypothetical protein [unclassified Campylobacter]MDA3042472.1 hypothetical protein [Campylobacter sp. JMF_09 ED2]MDA3044714.1 hypothetical protein [Campylobacter sp. JMF_07 ED4]MDA3063164.1 hypothetical protein [Campylobacter sp. JMF_11 EL3]MDA3071691.1 hypothetical protein [Campylobacter sp. VBCF_03 NA9]MDA3074245.1 hypothetical protein [Campylobacter sp. JMF_05 ED3]